MKSDPDGKLVYRPTKWVRVRTIWFYFILAYFCSDNLDAAVKRELALLKEKDKIATVKEKKIYKNMFERMAKEPEK
jgi:hypothetical protein